jgi:hypothetical protein
MLRYYPRFVRGEQCGAELGDIRGRAATTNPRLTGSPRHRSPRPPRPAEHDATNSQGGITIPPRPPRSSSVSALDPPGPTTRSDRSSSRGHLDRRRSQASPGRALDVVSTRPTAVHKSPWDKTSLYQVGMNTGQDVSRRALRIITGRRRRTWGSRFNKKPSIGLSSVNVLVPLKTW